MAARAITLTLRGSGKRRHYDGRRGRRCLERRLNSGLKFSEGRVKPQFMVVPGITGRVAFDGFLLDPGRRLLLRDGREVHLPPKAFDTLLLLVIHRDRVVTKDELLATVWTDVIVEENNLSQHISQLRKALGPRADGGAYIETVRGVGFRFGTAVTVVSADEAEMPAAL
ncbi:MAG: transcriptional regulator, partial [Vicinamibacteria bacterium]